MSNVIDLDSSPERPTNPSPKRKESPTDIVEPIGKAIKSSKKAPRKPRKKTLFVEDPKSSDDDNLLDIPLSERIRVTHRTRPVTTTTIDTIDLCSPDSKTRENSQKIQTNIEISQKFQELEDSQKTPENSQEISQKEDDELIDLTEEIRPQQKTKRKKLSDAQKQEKKEQKEREKQEKKQKKEEEKKLREEEKLKNKKKTKDSSVKEMIVTVDQLLLNEVNGAHILSKLQSIGCTTEVSKLPLQNSLLWSRKSDSVTQLPRILIRLTGPTFIDLVTSNSQPLVTVNFLASQGIPTYINTCRSLYPEHTLYFVIEGLESYFQFLKKENNKNFQRILYEKSNKDKIFTLGPDREDIEKTFSWLQITEKAHIKVTNNVEETAHYVSLVTQAIAFEPYSQKGPELDFCAETVLASNRISKSGNTWFGQLMLINGVSAAVAKAIIKNYPSFMSLMESYQSEGLTVKNKENLLAHLEREDITKTKIGPKLSTKIYRVFTETDGNLLVHDL